MISILVVAQEQIPLLFFMTDRNDKLSVAKTLCNDLSESIALPLDFDDLLKSIRSTRGFARLNIKFPNFSFENPKLNAGFEGTVYATHLYIRFLGDFEKVAETLFNCLVGRGLSCYSIWDKTILETWPKSEERRIDKGFSDRMTRVLRKKSEELRLCEPDDKKRDKLLDAFMKSTEFQIEMSREAKKEPGRKGRKSFDDLVNCHVRWKNAKPSASEYASIRKLSSKLAAMSLSELRAYIGDSNRVIIESGICPKRAEALRSTAEQFGLCVEIEPV